jgi:hypothetical protein
MFASAVFADVGVDFDITATMLTGIEPTPFIKFRMIALHRHYSVVLAAHAIISMSMLNRSVKATRLRMD